MESQNSNLHGNLEIHCNGLVLFKETMVAFDIADPSSMQDAHHKEPTKPYKPQCQHINSPYWLTYICCSAKCSWEKLFKIKRVHPSGDHFLNSRHLCT